MFLYGMRLMSASLKEGSSGTLKNVMEKVTNNPIKAFILGILITACIQSSTATIVITSGLVAAGIISLRQSLGIVIGANVGTTVTGQIIRLLDIGDGASSWLQFFKPSTLAPLALVAGIILIMFLKFDKSDMVGSIAIGFGILFSGLMNMTSSVSALNDSGYFGDLFIKMGDKPFMGYLTGAGVAFILQSSSATIGILQAFATTGQLTFKGIYAVLVGIYLGDCVTTAIVCSIGAKPDAKRVGIVNILFNLSETLLVLIVVTIVQKFGLLDSIWLKPITSGGIANTNTVFNLGCAIVLFPLIGVYEKLSMKIVKSEKEQENKYIDKFEALNPVFFNTPALAFRGCYEGLLLMFQISSDNFNKAMELFEKFDPEVVKEINEEEKYVDTFADRISNYIVQLSPHIREEYHIRILDQYYKLISQFERLGDHAVNIAEEAEDLNKNGASFSEVALHELTVVRELINDVLYHTKHAFENRDVVEARHIEPLEEVVDDMVNTMRDNHLIRLRRGMCNVYVDNDFLNLLTDLERISDICSNVGLSVVTRADPELTSRAHNYISMLHMGQDEQYNSEYEEAHEKYYSMLY